jgi:rubrerythrin
MSHLPSRTGPLGFNDLSRVAVVEDLFALAMAVENEGVRRYEELEYQMRTQGQQELASLFAHLREQEQGHGDSVTLLAQRAGLREIPQLSFRWDDLPEGVMPSTIGTQGALQAVRHALHNEQRTYALFLRIANATHVAEIRRQAELLASEELDHVALLSRRELALEDDQRALQPNMQAYAPRNIDAIRSMAATEAWVSAARRSAQAARLRANGDRWSATLMQDLSEAAEARCRSLGVRTPLQDLPQSMIPSNDNQSALEIVRQEAASTAEAGRGFMRLSSSLGVNGLASFANHETGLRLGAVAVMTDHMSSLRPTFKQPPDGRSSLYRPVGLV